MSRVIAAVTSTLEHLHSNSRTTAACEVGGCTDSDSATLTARTPTGVTVLPSERLCAESKYWKDYGTDEMQPERMLGDGRVILAGSYSDSRSVESCIAIPEKICWSLRFGLLFTSTAK